MRDYTHQLCLRARIMITPLKCITMRSILSTIILLLLQNFVMRVALPSRMAQLKNSPQFLHRFVRPNISSSRQLSQNCYRLSLKGVKIPLAKRKKRKEARLTKIHRPI